MKILYVCLAWLAFLGAARAASPVPLPELVRPIAIPFEQFTLENGLRVVVHTDRKAPVVAVSVWYGVGSGDEPAGKTGYAHLFEHLMFNGSENYDGEFFEPLDDVGATNSNGTTSFDRTNYFENVPTGALDRALFLEADRMGRLLPALTQAKLDNQRGVVQNEKRQRDNQPYGLVFYSIVSGLFPPGHPYHHTPIGSMADLDRATLADLQGWFRTHYGPNNAVLVLAGDIDAATARAKVERWFGAIPRGPQTPALSAPIPRTSAIVRETMTDRVPNPRLYIGWAGPGQTDAAYAGLDIATTILAGGASSRLYNDLVRDRQLAIDTGGFGLDNAIAGAAILYVDLKPGIDPKLVEARVDAVVAKFLKEGPTTDEVARVATRTVAGTIRGLEEVGGFGGKAVTLAEGALYADDPGFYRTELERYATATPASVLAASRAWLVAGGYRLTVVPGERGAAERALVGASGVKPSDAATPKAAKVTDRSKLPAATLSDTLVFPAVERARLSNGIAVVFARRAAVPVIELMASFDAGNAADDRAKPGTQALMLALMNEGTARRTGPALVEEGERLGASIGVSSGMDRTRATLSALAPNLAASLDLFADIVRNPAFAPAEIERVRAIALAGLAQEEAQPGALAARLLTPVLYGRAHPYGVPFSGSGTADGLKAVRRDDLVRFHARWIRPDTMQLFVVGDTTMAALLPELERVLGDWRAPGVARGTKSFGPVATEGGPRVILVDRPGAPQSYIAGGLPLTVRGTDDALGLMVANDLLGGSFTSRMNADLRETKGWSYGVRSSVAEVRETMPFIVRAPVQADRTGASIAALRDNMRALLGDRPVADDELGRTINASALSLPGDFETSGAVLTALERTATFGRADDYYVRLPARYRALDAARVEAAARGALDPARMIWVVVGDAKGVAPQLQGLGLPVEVRPGS